MNVKNSVRSLAALKDASSARVLNLLSVARIHGHKEEYRRKPLFDSPIFNKAILLKHRLRPDDQFLFYEPMRNAMKLVLPLDKSDLRLGGSSFFYGQRGFMDLIREMGNYGSVDMSRDLKTLEVLNDLPSLDPFLINERLQIEGIEVADCYLDLSESDKRRMQSFVAAEIGSLINLAYSREDQALTDASEHASAARLSSAILAVGEEAQLEPLRRSLLLAPQDFRRGVFSWRGFLYYKWRCLDLLPKVKQVFREIVELPVVRSDRADDVEVARQFKRRLGRQISTVGAQVTDAIKLYDTNYKMLTQGKEPQFFRDFLMAAPHMFVDLGEKFGGLAHIESFWRFRFPVKRTKPMRADEAIPILTDFATSVGLNADLVAHAN